MIDGRWVADVDAQEFDIICKMITDAGIIVPALSSRIGNWDTPIDAPFREDIDELHRLSERAHKLGCKFVRIMSYPNSKDNPLDADTWRNAVLERMSALTHEAEISDVVLVHENCAGWAGLGAQQSVDLVQSISSPHLRLLCDIGNCVAYGYDAISFVQETMPWTEHVHVKDALRCENGETTFTWPGDGSAQVIRCINMLLEGGYGGSFCIEPHLHLIPHLKQSTTSEILSESFFEYGTRLERLYVEQGCQEGVAST